MADVKNSEELSIFIHNIPIVKSAEVIAMYEEFTILIKVTLSSWNLFKCLVSDKQKKNFYKILNSKIKPFIPDELELMIIIVV